MKANKKYHPDQINVFSESSEKGPKLQERARSSRSELHWVRTYVRGKRSPRDTTLLPNWGRRPLQSSALLADPKSTQSPTQTRPKTKTSGNPARPAGPAVFVSLSLNPINRQTYRAIAQKDIHFSAGLRTYGRTYVCPYVRTWFEEAHERRGAGAPSCGNSFGCCQWEGFGLTIACGSVSGEPLRLTIHAAFRPDRIQTNPRVYKLRFV